MQRKAQLLNKVLSAAFGAVASLLLFLLMMLTFADVVGRNALHKPISGSGELTELSLFVIIFLMLPQVTVRHQHIVINLLDKWIGPLGSLLQRLLNAVLGAGMFAIIGWQLWNMAERAGGYGETLPTLQLPLAPFLYLMAVMSWVSAAAFLVSAANPITDAASESISVG